MSTAPFVFVYGLFLTQPWLDLALDEGRADPRLVEWTKARMLTKLPTPEQFRTQIRDQVREWRRLHEPSPYSVSIQPLPSDSQENRERFEVAAAAFRILQPVPDARLVFFAPLAAECMPGLPTSWHVAIRDVTITPRGWEAEVTVMPHFVNIFIGNIFVEKYRCDSQGLHFLG